MPCRERSSFDRLKFSLPFHFIDTGEAVGNSLGGFSVFFFLKSAADWQPVVSFVIY